MSKSKTIFGVTSFDLGGNAGFVVHCLFTTHAEAEKYAAEDKGYEIDEFELYSKAPSPYTYWHRGAEVYPDGSVQAWRRSHQAQPPGEMAEADVEERGAFDGHWQGHCGLHISIFGTDREAVEKVYKSQLATARASMNGACPGCGKTDDYVAGFWGEKRRSRLSPPTGKDEGA